MTDNTDRIVRCIAWVGIAALVLIAIMLVIG